VKKAIANRIARNKEKFDLFFFCSFKQDPLWFCIGVCPMTLTKTALTKKEVDSGVERKQDKSQQPSQGAHHTIQNHYKPIRTIKEREKPGQDILLPWPILWGHPNIGNNRKSIAVQLRVNGFWLSSSSSGHSPLKVPRFCSRTMLAYAQWGHINR
jgi:hypothetical protein